jgi:hypothetical protein
LTESLVWYECNVLQLHFGVLKNHSFISRTHFGVVYLSVSFLVMGVSIINIS